MQSKGISKCPHTCVPNGQATDHRNENEKERKGSSCTEFMISTEWELGLPAGKSVLKKNSLKINWGHFQHSSSSFLFLSSQANELGAIKQSVTLRKVKKWGQCPGRQRPDKTEVNEEKEGIDFLLGRRWQRKCGREKIRQNPRS